MPFEPFLPKPPGPPQGDGFDSRTAKNLEGLNRMALDLQRYINTFQEIRTETKDSEGNPIILTVLAKLQQPGTGDSSDYDFKCTPGTAPNTVAVADGLVGHHDLANTATTGDDPIPTKVFYQFTVTTSTDLNVADGDGIYIKITYTPAYYSYPIAVDVAAVSGTAHADAKIYSTGSADVKVIASATPPVPTPPGAATDPMIGYIYLATAHITGGVVSLSGQFPREIYVPLLILPCHVGTTP